MILRYGNPSDTNTDTDAFTREGATIYGVFYCSFRLSVVLRQAGAENEAFRFVPY
jgi:hypothetical protein